LPDILFPHQKDIVKWCLLGGRRACFASFGLGKSVMQLTINKIIVQRKPNARTLIICPLGVKQEFQRDAALIDMDPPKYVRNNAEIEASDNQHFITNYERVREGGIDVNLFECVCLDEASVLRSFGSKTYQEFLSMFANVPFRFVFTATPSPNRHKELIHYSAFLGIMDSGQALTRFFARNSQKANELTIYPHKEQEFWAWMSSWAVFVQRPSDLGYEDGGYDLPKLNVHWHCLPVNHQNDKPDSWGQYEIFREAAVSLPSASREKRESIFQRLTKAIDIIEHTEKEQGAKNWLLWHDLEAERGAIEAVARVARKEGNNPTFEGCHTVYGTQDLEEREKLIIDFSNGVYPILATKPEIAGSGCNFQRHCSSNIFLGVNYSFNDFIQAIHRTYRFGQQNEVDVHVLFMESESSIVKVLQDKWKKHDELTNNMAQLIREHGLGQSALTQLRRSLGCQRFEMKGANYTIANNDCINETMEMEDDSIGLVLTSIPFSNHYEYSPSYNDFGHTDNDAHFFEQMDFLIPELYRTLKPGRIAAIHVKDRILFGNVTGLGFPTVNPFSHKTTSAFLKHGFAFMGQITITTDVVRENNQTYRLGWTEQCRDGSKMGCGSPEYLLIFRKPQTDRSSGRADEPVFKDKDVYTRRNWQIDAHALYRSSGNRLLTPDEIAKAEMPKIINWFKDYKNDVIYDYVTHVDLGKELEQIGRMPSTFMLFDPAINTDNVWSDILRMRTLNSEQSKKNEENHICPFQIDIVERAINRWSNVGDVVYDPFGGLMTVPVTAIKMDRYGRGAELNPQYFDCGRRYCFEAEYKKETPTLFDLMEFTLNQEAEPVQL
jgi:DNA modification methylase